MIAIARRERGMARRRRQQLGDGTEYFKGEWLETGEDAQLSPLMFLVEQAPGAVLPSHFHLQNEFQLVVQGSGRFGAHAVGEFALHYAGAYTGYGPIVPGLRGLSYFTIRAVFETGGKMLPESRHEMVRGPKRQWHSGPIEPLSAAQWAGLREVRTVDLLDEPADRLAARRLLIPPHRQAPGLNPAGSSGVFHVVLGGALALEGEPVRALESVFASAGENPLALQAGDAGADVLCLRVPLRAPEYSQPAALAR